MALRIILGIAMLEQLIIKNLAIIEHLNIELCSGMNVFTGETGAGKSIIVGALNILLGSKFQAELIKDVEKRAVVEASFRLNKNNLSYAIILKLAEDLAYDIEDDQIIFKREFSIEKKGRCFLNGSPIPLTKFKEFASYFVKIYGQHENQKLLNILNQKEIFDAYCKKKEAKFSTVLSNHKTIYSDYLKVMKERISLEKMEENREREIQDIEEALHAIENLQLQKDEYVNLLKEEKRIRNSKEILLHLSVCNDYFYTKNISENLEKLNNSLSKLQNIQSSFSSTVKATNESLYFFEEARLEFAKHNDSTNVSPKRMEEVEERLMAIQSLCKKQFGKDIFQRNKEFSVDKEISKRKKDLENKRDTLLDASRIIDEVKIREKKLSVELSLLSKKLSEYRLKAIPKLEEEMAGELESLNMISSRFKISLKWEIVKDSSDKVIFKEEGIEYRIQKDGMDNIEFLLAIGDANLRPLRRIASGGELSRLMLALNNVSIPDTNSALLVFDEVDAGVGGAVAESIGEKLKKLSKKNQVMVITHLAQIASQASEKSSNNNIDGHYIVKKHIVEKQNKKESSAVSSTVTRLLAEDRIQEIARMLGGKKITAKILAHAKELLTT